MVRDFLVLSASATHGDVPQSAAFSPVPPACFTEVPRLREAVVVVVAELGVSRIASGTF